MPTRVSDLYDSVRISDGNPFEHPAMYWLYLGAGRDGIQRALAKHQDYKDLGGWQSYDFKDGKWQEGPQRPYEYFYNYDFLEIQDGREVRLPGFYMKHTDFFSARSDEFHILRKKGGESKLIVITGGGEDDRYGYHVAWRKAFHITIDAEGYLKTIPIPEFSFDEMKFNLDDLEQELSLKYPKIKRETEDYKLESVKTETFYPPAPPPSAD